MKNKFWKARIWVMIGILAGFLVIPNVSLRLMPSVYAQVTTATLGGLVADSTGAVIPGATITLTNTLNGDVRTQASNGSGLFTFAAVPTGDYKITIRAKGFRSYERSGVHLDPGDQRTVRDISLQPGDVSQTVEVTTTANTINIDSGEQSTLISAEEIQHLSVEGRDVTELQKILPGFAISRGGAGTFDNQSYDPSQVNPSGGLGQYAANGTPVNGQALLSDGVDITDPGNFGQAIQNVNYDWVAEVKVQTSSFTADTAHGPIVFNAVGKSGGNSYHGSLYTYARAPQLNATDWLTKYTDQPKPGDRYVYPGFTLGGPFAIPGTKINQSKRLTFFVGAEDYAQRNVYAYGSSSSATLTALVPTANMRKGVFNQAEVQNYLGNQYGIDPNGGACTYQGQSSNVPDQNICRVAITNTDGTPLSNNTLTNIDPLGQIILNDFPLPNTASNGTYNWITTNLVNDDLWEAHGRFDFAATEKSKLFGVYTIERGYNGVPQVEYYSPRGNLGGINVPGGGLLSTIHSQTTALNFTHIFSSSLTNELYAAGAYFVQDFVDRNPSASENNPYQGVFLNGSKVQPALEDYGNDGLPLSLTPDTTFGGIFAKKQVRIAGDNLTKVIGKHAIRAGVFYQWDDNPQVAPFIQTNGDINAYYIGELNQDPVKGTIHGTGPVGSGSGGNYLADIAEGLIFQYAQTNIAPEPNLYFWNFAGYAQDHYLVSRHLSLDGGVRFEHMTPWQDTHNLGIGIFSPTAYANGSPSALPGVLWHANDSAIPNAGRPTRWGFIEPRVGFAWDIRGNGQTLLRGGFGIYRAHDSYNDADNEASTAIGSRSYTVTGPLLLSSVSSYQSQANQPGGFVPDTSIYAFNPNDDEEPRVRTYNLSLDQRLPLSMVLEISYVGNTSDKLLNDGSTQNTTLDDLNSLPVGTLFGPQPNTRPDTASTAGTVYPIFGPAAGGNNTSVGSLQQNVIDTYKKYPLYDHVYVPTHNAYSNYNALQVALTRQVGRAHYNVNYTWSKALGILGIGGSATYSYPADPFNYRNDYSFMPFDRRNIFNAAYSYDLGNFSKNLLVGGFTNGWQISGIVNFQSGQNLPSTISSNFGITGTITVPVGTVAAVGSNSSTCQTTSGTGTCQFGVSSTNVLGTPDVNLQPLIVGDPQARTAKFQYVNGNAFSLPQLGSNGAYRYGYLPGPGYFNADLTAAKNFHITGDQSLQFRVAAFNFLNHPLNTFTSVQPSNYTLTFSENSAQNNLNQALAASNAGSGNPQFGFAPLREGRRIMELALRYTF